MSDWQPIETAPKDGTPIEVRSASSGEAFDATWDPEGDSWVGGELVVTGIWATDCGGWLQPDEVSHWRPRKSK